MRPIKSIFLRLFCVKCTINWILTGAARQNRGNEIHSIAFKNPRPQLMSRPGFWDWLMELARAPEQNEIDWIWAISEIASTELSRLFTPDWRFVFFGTYLRLGSFLRPSTVHIRNATKKAGVWRCGTSCAENGSGKITRIHIYTLPVNEQRVHQRGSFWGTK